MERAFEICPSYDLLAIDVLFHAEFLVICLGIALKNFCDFSYMIPRYYRFKFCRLVDFNSLSFNVNIILKNIRIDKSILIEIVQTKHFQLNGI